MALLTSDSRPERGHISSEYYNLSAYAWHSRRVRRDSDHLLFRRALAAQIVEGHRTKAEEAGGIRKGRE